MINIYNSDIKRYGTSAIEAIQSGWVSNHGSYIELAKTKIESLYSIRHAILMANGTCATHCLFLALKYKYPNINKIYVPNNVYVAAWNAALMVYKTEQLHVMKIDINTWNIQTSEEYINTLDLNSAVLIVHNIGNIVNVPRLKRLRPDLVFVEDNCEGFTGKYENIYSGTSEGALCSCASFYGNKIITSGEGGAFMTQHSDIYEYINRVYSQGMSNVRYLHDIHAYNYRMTNVEAALLYEQLNDIENIMNNKKRVFDNYTKLLTPLVNNGMISLFKPEDETVRANWMFAIRIIDNTKTIEETNEFFLKK